MFCTCMKLSKFSLTVIKWLRKCSLGVTFAYFSDSHSKVSPLKKVPRPSKDNIHLYLPLPEATPSVPSKDAKSLVAEGDMITA